MVKMLSAVILSLSISIAMHAQSSPQPASALTVIRAGTLVDGVSDSPRKNQLVFVRGERIEKVAEGSAAIPAGTKVIDLANATVLPGLIDAHTHIFLWGEDPAKGGYDANILKAGIALRAARATYAARRALEQGFVALRDLETEGAMYADVDVKHAINNGEVPGPHMQVSTRAMTPTGMYGPYGYSWEITIPQGVQYVDGVDEARKAVREQIRYGADWIKYYSDHGYFYGPDGVILHSHVNFTDEEAKAIVDETHRLGHKVAAHAIGSDGIAAALKAGVDSIEHGDGLTEPQMEEMARRGIYWVPTIMVGAYVAPGRAGNWTKMVDTEKAAFQLALKKGVKIVLGTDAGGFDWRQLNQALEFDYYVKYGMTPMQAIRTATTTAAELLGWSDKMGTIEKGKWADMVAVASDPLKDITELQRVKFVMKSGSVFKNDLH